MVSDQSGHVGWAVRAWVEEPADVLDEPAW